MRPVGVLNPMWLNMNCTPIRLAVDPCCQLVIKANWKPEGASSFSCLEFQWDADRVVTCVWFPNGIEDTRLLPSVWEQEQIFVLYFVLGLPEQQFYHTLCLHRKKDDYLFVVDNVILTFHFKCVLSLYHLLSVWCVLASVRDVPEISLSLWISHSWMKRHAAN